MAENCYFFVDMEQDVPDDQRCVSVLCVECRTQHYPNAGWFWEGSTQGYGRWAYNCYVCGKDVSQDTNEETTAAFQNP